MTNSNLASTMHGHDEILGALRVLNDFQFPTTYGSILAIQESIFARMEIDKLPAMKILKENIEGSLQISDNHGYWFSGLNIGFSIGSSIISKWLAWRSLIESPEAAVKHLYHALSGGPFKSYYITAIGSFYGGERVYINESTYIDSLVNMANSGTFLNEYYDGIKEINIQSGALIIHEFISSPISRIAPGEPGKILPISSEVVRNIRDLCSATSLVRDHVAVPISSVVFTDPLCPPGIFGGRAYGINGSSFRIGPVFYNASEINRYRDRLLAIQNLDEREKWIRISKRLSAAKTTNDISEGFLDLGIALESLLIGKGASQLNLALKLRGAWLLGSSKEERMKICETLNKLYEIRSEVAHSGYVYRASYQKWCSRENLSMCISLCERIIERLYFMDSEPNWDSLILGAGGDNSLDDAT